jgi:DNA repair protein SbcD/Mre11
MAGLGVKLLHAAGVQLDVPLRSVGKVPREIAELLSSATLVAWERLVDAAIAQGVDGLLLTGNTFDAESDSLAADVALRQGCERLLEHEIPVFVTPGRLDPLAAWQQIPALPDNVTLFDSPWDAAVDLTDHGKLLARLMPVAAQTATSSTELARLQSQAKSARDSGGVSVGLLWDGPHLADDEVETAATGDRRYASLHVLCCGAEVAESELPVTEGVIQRQASPQGMTSDDVGPRGATLLHFDGQRQLSKRFVALGPVRRERLTMRLDSARHRDELCEQMLAALEELATMPGEQVRIIRWAFAGTAESRSRLQFNDAAMNEVLETVTGLTDQAGGLRYLHEPIPLWQDLTVPAELGELWREYLEYFDEHPPVSAEQLRALAMELRPQQATTGGTWERWLATIDPQGVQQRARKYARKWFGGST